MLSASSCFPSPGSGFPASAEAGATLVETMVGASLAAFGLIGLYVTGSQCLGMTRAHREILTAEHCLEQRVEQCCAATWTQLTTPAGVQALLSAAPVNHDALNNHAERITVSAYPTVVPAVGPLVVTRDADGNTAVAAQPPAGFNMQNSAAVRVDLQETWTSAQGGRPRSRETSTVVTNGGWWTR